MHNLDNTRESTSAYVTDEELEASVAQDEYPLTDAQYLFPEQEISSELDELAAELTMLDSEVDIGRFFKKFSGRKLLKMGDTFLRTPPAVGAVASLLATPLGVDPISTGAKAAIVSGMYNAYRQANPGKPDDEQSEFELNKRFIRATGNALSQAEKNHADGMPAKAALNKAVKRVQQELNVDLFGEYEFAAY